MAPRQSELGKVRRGGIITHHRHGVHKHVVLFRIPRKKRVCLSFNRLHRNDQQDPPKPTPRPPVTSFPGTWQDGASDGSVCFAERHIQSLSRESCLPRSFAWRRLCLTGPDASSFPSDSDSSVPGRCSVWHAGGNQGVTESTSVRMKCCLDLRYRIRSRARPDLFSREEFNVPV